MIRVAHVPDVHLEVFDPATDLSLLERWLWSPHVVRWWGSPDRNLATLARQAQETQALIIADGEAVGFLCWRRLPPSELETAELTGLPEDLVDIDIAIGESEFLGRGVGSRALVLLLARLRGEGLGFAGLGTSVSNRRAIRAFEKAGFRLSREFEDPEHGLCKYMVAPLSGVVEQMEEADGATPQG